MMMHGTRDTKCPYALGVVSESPDSLLALGMISRLLGRYHVSHRLIDAPSWLFSMRMYTHTPTGTFSTQMRLGSIDPALRT